MHSNLDYTVRLQMTSPMLSCIQTNKREQLMQWWFSDVINDSYCVLYFEFTVHPGMCACKVHSEVFKDLGLADVKKMLYSFIQFKLNFVKINIDLNRQ